MKVTHSIAAMREATTDVRQPARPVALVPTMGALHEGHATLMRRAAADGAVVAASIYVNPTQFGPKEDFTKYPRTLESDCAICERAGVSLVFAPTDEEMYPDGPAAVSTWVDELLVAKRLEGERRPGHFRGVCTVVAKLFNIVQPDRAYFGQKDYQQLKVIQRMVRDLRYPIEVVPVATVREPDGLAMSSRNRYLSSSERSQATVLWRALNTARELLANGERDAAALQSAMAKMVGEGLEYAEITDPGT